jgi:hypothetical protein
MTIVATIPATTWRKNRSPPVIEPRTVVKVNKMDMNKQAAKNIADPMVTGRVRGAGRSP